MYGKTLQMIKNLPKISSQREWDKMVKRGFFTKLDDTTIHRRESISQVMKINKRN